MRLVTCSVKWVGRGSFSALQCRNNDDLVPHSMLNLAVYIVGALFHCLTGSVQQTIQEMESPTVKIFRSCTLLILLLGMLPATVRRDISLCFCFIYRIHVVRCRCSSPATATAAASFSHVPLRLAVFSARFGCREPVKKCSGTST